MKFSRWVADFFLAGLSVTIFFAGSVHAANPDISGDKMKKMPDLIQACAKECPDARTNEEAVSCITKLDEKVGGEKALKKMHPICYNAHLKYEGMKNEAESAQNEPYRYG